MVRALALACLAGAGLSCFAQTKIVFQAVDRASIEKRLHLDSSNNRERLAALRALFEEAGCKGDRLAEQPVKHADTPNLVCTFPGDSQSTIVIGGHFDAVFAGKGIVDNWSGASLLPSLYQALAIEKRRHTLVFAGFTAEEKGLVGSQAWLKQFPKSETGRIRAMINMDTLGLGQTAVWLSHADPQLVRFLTDISVAFKIPLHATNVEKVGSTDSEPFRERKIPAITLHSITQDTLPILHSKRDQFEAIQLDDYYQSYKLIAAYIAYLDMKLDPDLPIASGTTAP